jgi:plastocyanin
MRQTILAALLTTTLLAGCGGGEDNGAPARQATTPAAAAGAAGARTDTIKIVDFVYDPTPATVRAGQPIAIANADAAPHTITDGAAGAKAFDSGTIKGKAKGSLMIDEPGTYSYICEFHPFMKGEIIVRK